MKAAHLGQLSDVPSHKIGAILVHRKGIVATGFNQRKSHPLQAHLNQLRGEGKRDRSYIHAEISCLAGMRKVPDGAILFVGRFDLRGQSAMCRPCEACLSAIKSKGIREIAYSTPDGFAVEHLA